MDLDFILSAQTTQALLDQALSDIEFARDRDRYVHPSAPFFVEFPRGPLAIGEDLDIRPVVRRKGEATVTMLSATDSCRDRLAAYYHWSDLQSLRAAVEIASRHRVSIARVRDWSIAGGAEDRLVRFEKALAERRDTR